MYLLVKIPGIQYLHRMHRYDTAVVISATQHYRYVRVTAAAVRVLQHQRGTTTAVFNTW